MLKKQSAEDSLRRCVNNLLEEHRVLRNVAYQADRLSLAAVGITPDPEKFREAFIDLNIALCAFRDLDKSDEPY